MKPLTPRATILWACVTVAAFHLAYTGSMMSALIAVYLFGLFNLSRQASDRRAFYSGLAIGMLVYGPQLSFFWRLFGPPAVALWLVLAFWLGLFLWALRQARRWREGWTVVLLAPFLWTGLEYFRSELYPLRFSWLNIGYAFSHTPRLDTLVPLGMFGLGFILMLAAAALSLLSHRRALIAALLGLAGMTLYANWPRPLAKPDRAANSVPVAGLQLEFPAALEIPPLLDQLVRRYPRAQIIVLSEYTLDGEVPQCLQAWCRKNHRYLVVGGKDHARRDQFYNTVFVVDSQGAIVFSQAKAVPIQFFQDGLPARQQRVWESPWGKIGVCICYDLSYTRVVDRLVQLGAQALIVPTMDVADWGAYEHQLHARVAPVRAAECGLPIFRLASSGVSQLINRQGRVQQSAPFPGTAAMLFGELELVSHGALPLDRALGLVAVGVTALFFVGLAIKRIRTSLEQPSVRTST